MAKSRWEQVGGDYGDPIVFGGYFINHKTNELWYVKGIDFYKEPDDDPEPNVYFRNKNGTRVEYYRKPPDTILVYRASLTYDDPLDNGWVKWDEVLRHSGEQREPKDIPIHERIRIAADYYGWANFDDYPIELTEAVLRKKFKAIL